MPLTKRFFIWNAAAVLISVLATSLIVMIYLAIRTQWLRAGKQPSDSSGNAAPIGSDAGSMFPPGEAGGIGAPLPLEEAMNVYAGVGLVAFGCFILIFLTLNLLVSRRFSHGIIQPITRLTDAAVKIREGNLSVSIAEEGEGEVKELSRSLEQMRLKLKESIYMQERYEDNRKFLLSSISHDLKTPVTSIRGYIEGIIDGVASTPEKQAQYLETARSKALQVNNMIDDLLLYSKLDLDQQPYHFESTDMQSYFEDCLADYQYEYQKLGIQLQLTNKLNEPVTIRVDRERFKRVMQNVLDNARKHVPATDGRIDLILRETRTSAIVEVRDNGPGIPEDQLPHIFDRFYRADASRSNPQNSGLGLAIARQIVAGHEGRIWATSTVGEGTRVMISLRKIV